MRQIDVDALLSRLKNPTKAEIKRTLKEEYDNAPDEEIAAEAILNMYATVIDAINKEPTIESPNWIPCAKQPPTSGKHVLLTCEIRPRGTRYVCDGFYAEKLSISGGYDCDPGCDYDEDKDEYFIPEGYYEIVKNWDDYSSIVINDFVVAWQPLPDPWNGHDESAIS